MYGLTTEIIQDLQVVFSQFDEIEKVVLYGSRAMDRYRNGSDIDITLLGKKLTIKTIVLIEEEIEKLCLPYLFDISLYSQIDNPELVSHINRVGKVLYHKASKQ